MSTIHYLAKWYIRQSQIKPGLVKTNENTIAQLPQWKTNIKAAEEKKLADIQGDMRHMQRETHRLFGLSIALKLQEHNYYEATRSLLELLQFEIKSFAPEILVLTTLKKLILEGIPYIPFCDLPRFIFKTLKAYTYYKLQYGPPHTHLNNKGKVELDNFIDNSTCFIKRFYLECLMENVIRSKAYCQMGKYFSGIIPCFHLIFNPGLSMIGAGNRERICFRF